MKIYRIKMDYDNVQSIGLKTQMTDAEHANLFRFNCDSLLQNWPRLDVRIIKTAIIESTFLSFMDLCFKEAIKTQLSIPFGEVGEFLPMYLSDSIKVYIFNILNCIDALDKAQTIFKYYSSGTRGHVIKHVFDKSKIEGKPSIFKIPETPTTHIFAYTDCPSLDPSRDFYKIYHENNWSGLKFELIE